MIAQKPVAYQVSWLHEDNVLTILGFDLTDEISLSEMLRRYQCDFKVKSGKRKLFGHTLHDAESLFRALDTDYSGDVDRQELRMGLKALKIGCTMGQLEAWLDALDVNGDGTIEEHEFVGFLEGSLDPELNKQMSDMAASLVHERPRPRSPLLVDKILSGGTAIGSADAGAASEFIDTLQKLENLYIHRLGYQQKISATGLGDPRKRKGVGIDLLLDVDTVKQTDALESKLQKLIDDDSVKEGGGDLGQFFLLWREHWQHMHADRVLGHKATKSFNKIESSPLPSKIMYDLEMKRRAIHERPAKVAWRAAITPAKSPARDFSHPGYLSESWTETKDYFTAKQEGIIGLVGLGLVRPHHLDLIFMVKYGIEIRAISSEGRVPVRIAEAALVISARDLVNFACRPLIARLMRQFMLPLRARIDTCLLACPTHGIMRMGHTFRTSIDLWR